MTGAGSTWWWVGGRADVPGESYAIVYYDLLDHLQKNPDVVVTFRRGGLLFRALSRGIPWGIRRFVP